MAGRISLLYAYRNPDMSHNFDKIIDYVVFDVPNYPTVGSLTPKQAGGPVSQQVTFSTPLPNVNEIELIGVNVVNPYSTQQNLTITAGVQRDPYFLITLAGFSCTSRVYVNGMTFNGAVVLNPGSVTASNLFHPVSFIQDSVHPGNLTGLNVTIQRPVWTSSDITTVKTVNTGVGPSAVTSPETNTSPLFDRMVLLFKIHRLGNSPIQSAVPVNQTNLLFTNPTRDESHLTINSLLYQNQKRF